jgi:LmbE family N-acetylglucosaminyl deacetylase
MKRAICIVSILAVILAACLTNNADSGSSNTKTVIDVLRDSKRVLWIAAHPDDETSSSALLTRAKNMSGTLFLASLTRGENSDILWGGLRRGSAMGAARQALFTKAAALFKADAYDLGPFINGPHSLGELDARPANAPYQDWPPQTTSSQGVIAKWKREGDPLEYVVKLLRQWRPDVVISMDDHCGVSGHPEHIATARVLLQAIPLAADPSAYPGVSEPWRVHYVVFSAQVIPQLVACRYCKCEGSPPAAPPEEVLTLELSGAHGMTYFGVKCLVARTYQNTMETKGWTDVEIQAGCEKVEAAATRALQEERKGQPFFEPYRVIPVN